MSEFENYLLTEESKTFFTCKACNRKTELLFPEKVNIFACQCGKIHCEHDYKGYYYTGNQFANKGLLKLGQQANLDGEIWEIVGIANKFNTKLAFDRWIEYVMFNKKTEKFSFLNCAYGNYTWLFERERFKDLDSKKSEKPRILEVDGEVYKLYQRYSYRSNSIIGQFPYDPIQSKDINCADFVSPPNAISIEENVKTNEFSYFQGRHFYRKEIASVFKDDRIVYQSREGVGMAQPFYGKIDVGNFSRIGIGFILLLLLLNFGIFNQFHHSKEITSFSVTSSTETRSSDEFVTQSFVLKEQVVPHYLNVYCGTFLNNEWLEAAITLVNEKTGDERELGLVLEHYSGDGWEEGSNANDIGISEVPAGKYHFKLKIYSDSVSDKSISFIISEENPSNWNFWLIGFIALGIILLMTFVKQQFERMRSGEIDTLFG
ncbi:MAG: DUF4178 domain-containing protein [Flavobacteriales bacterium]|nr:DUF4178 domain-containing protein [Flavobacteriales bacterium]